MSSQSRSESGQGWGCRWERDLECEGGASRRSLGLGCTRMGRGKSLVPTMGQRAPWDSPGTAGASLQPGKGDGGFSPPQRWGRRAAVPGVTPAEERAPFATAMPRALLQKPQGNGMSGLSWPAAQRVGEPQALPPSLTPPGVAWQGGDAGTLGQQRLAEGLAEPITPRAALPRRREPQITAQQAEPGSAPGLAWADTGPKGRPRARLSPADRPPAPLHPTFTPHALDKQLASLRPWRSPRRAFPRLSHRFGGSLGGKTPP